MKQLLDQTKFFDANDYEYNKTSKTGIMLIHGFTSTNYELKKLIDFLASKDLHVCAYNLPGHASSVQECNQVSYRDWINFTEMKFADLSSSCDKIFICGISMGALLAMHLSIVFPINGLISAAPVLEFNKPFKIHMLNPFFCRLLKSRAKKHEVNKGQKIYYGYNKWPLIALNEVRKLSKYINNDVLPKISCPSLLIHSKDDKTSIFNNLSIVQNNIGSEDITTLIVNKSHHNMFDCDNEKELLHSSILKFIRKYS